MLHLHKINPMVRAVGTVGAVAALVGGITFAQIQSNTVSLSNNTLTSATASLLIGLTTNCSDGTGSVQGMNFNNLVPNTASSPFAFCVDNTGDAPLDVSVNVPGDFTGSAVAPADVSLHFTCGVGGATTGAVDVTKTVADLNAAPVAFGDNSLTDTTNNVLSCNVTATLDGNVSGSNASLTPFSLDFTGTIPETTPSV